MLLQISPVITYHGAFQNQDIGSGMILAVKLQTLLGFHQIFVAGGGV